MVQQVSDSELELMRIIWAKGGRVLYAQIMDDLMAAGSRWQKNTVITLLSRLVEKGLLKTNKIGRRNEYAALITEADYQALQAEKLIEKFYKGNAKGLVSTLIQRDMLTSEDYEELRKFWEEGNRGQ